MPRFPLPFSRRAFLHAAAASGALAAGAVYGQAQDEPANVPETAPDTPEKPRGPLRVAALSSVFRLRSHSYHIVGRLVHGYQRNGFHHQPDVKVVSMWNHQSPENDMSADFCKRHDIRRCDTILEALMPDSEQEPDARGLDVDAVLLIIEHGDYPQNELGQVLYPRHQLFQDVVDVFRRVGQTAPIFVDKHLSYDHVKAFDMVATSRKMGFGLMAGSSLPVTWRIPEIEPALDTPFEEGLVVFGYEPAREEIYLIHALETLQSTMERRRGGETGVRSVQCLRGEDVWNAARAGRFSPRLLEAALRRCPSNNVGSIQENVLNPTALLIEYDDGTRGSVVNLYEQTSEFAFAASVKGQRDPVSALFYLPPPPGARFFDPLTYHIERFMATGVPPYPVERTLLTSTLLDLGLRSGQTGKPVSSEALMIGYEPPKDSGFFRGPVTDDA